MATRYALDSLLLYDPDRSSSTANVWVARPTPSEEQALGKLFVVSTITTPSRLNPEIITILQDEIRTHYYQSTETLFEAAFEQALARVNQRLHMLIIEGINEWVDSANFIIGAFRGEHMILTVVGDMNGFLLRDRRLQPIFVDYEPAAINPLRVLSTTWQSSLREGDRLVFSTPSLLDYFSMEKIRRTVMDHTPTEASRALEASLLGVDMHQAIAALVLEPSIDAEDQAAPEPQATTHFVPARTAPQMSMEELNARERQTEKLLSPSVWPAISDIGQQLGSGFSRFVRTVIFRRPPKRDRPVGMAMVNAPRTSPAWWRFMLSIGQSFTMIIRVIGISIYRAARRNRNQSIPSPTNLSAAPSPRRRVTLSNILESAIRGILRMRRAQQLALGGAVILVVILFATIIHLSGGPTTSTKSTNTPVQASQIITTEVAKAEAALLYGGNDAAAASLKTAQAALASLPQKSKDDKVQYAALAKTVNTLRQKVVHLNVVANPTVWLDLAAAKLATTPSAIGLNTTSVFVLDAKKNALIIAPRATPSSAITAVNTLDTGTLVRAAADSTHSFLMSTDRAGFVRYDTIAKTWKPIDATFPYSNPSITAMTSFQNRLYVLDATKNAIIRFGGGATSLGAGASWLKETAQFPTAKDVAVDGSVYVLQANGTVQAFLQGKRSTFALQTIDPPLTSAAQIWTDGTSANLYILDPAGHRFLVFTKQGRLLDQYQSNRWTALTDIIADEKTKTAYVLNGTAIDVVTLLH